MAILITGAGLIGTQIAKLYLDSEESVVLYDVAPQLNAIREFIDVSKIKLIRGDILDYAFLANVLKTHRIETIIHTAAMFPAGINKNLYNGIRINTDGTLNVLEASRLVDVKRIIYTSTVGVYWKESPADTFDEMLTPTKPHSLYAATKLMGESIGENYAKIYDMDFRIVRFANVIGPWGAEISSGVGSFINELVHAAVSNTELHIQRPYPMVLDAEWVYSKDAASGVFQLATTNGLTNKIFNIGTGSTTKSEEIIKMIQEIVPSTQITLGSAEPMGVRPLNIQRARNELGWVPKYDMKSMLTEMIAWHKAHQ